MQSDIAQLPYNADQPFVFVPSGLSRAYLEGVFARQFGEPVVIRGCVATNLCSRNWGGVSCSGATVLRLDLSFDRRAPLAVVAKILAPDPINTFKGDVKFEARIAEVQWARWWARQNQPFTPLLYDSRADCPSREFWILSEYFAEQGCKGTPAPDRRDFAPDMQELGSLFDHVAYLHAHSHNKLGELLRLMPDQAMSPEAIVEDISGLLTDTEFMKQIEITPDEASRLELYRRAIVDRPKWVDGWDLVCVTADWAPDNVGVRTDGANRHLVFFDWGTTRIAPMEEDLFVLLGRLGDLDSHLRQDLVRRYLQVYNERARRAIPYEDFSRRLPWSWFLVHMRYLVGAVRYLRWAPRVSRDWAHFCIRVAEGMLAGCER